ncbi:AAA family ATPase [Amycolatopsis sp. NPDC005003]
MPLDQATEHFLTEIRFKPAREVLGRWAADNDIRLHSENWSGSGFTSAELVGVTVSRPGSPPRCTVVKIKPHPGRSPGSEQSAHRQARLDAESFARDHMTGLPYDVLSLPDGGQIMFQDVAGGGFGELIGSAEIGEKHISAVDTYRDIVTSLLTEWNRAPAPPTRVPVQKVLARLLGPRVEPGGTLHAWAAPHRGLLDGSRRWLAHGSELLVNPFALAGDESFAPGVTVFDFPGKIHGDLHPGNLLVARTATKPVEYHLVDLSRYQPDGPLPWDPAYLMLTAAAPYLQRMRPRQRQHLREGLLDPTTPQPKLPVRLAQTITGIHLAEQEYVRPDGQVTNWRKLRLTCVAAIGLILSGRSIIGPREREWYFWLAAHAATELADQAVPQEDQDPLPPILIPHSPVPVTVSSPAGRGGEPAPAAARARRNRRMFDREPDERDLRTLLSAGNGGIVIVHGPSGVGKTVLVDWVLEGLEQSGLRVERREALPDIPFDVRTLTEAVGGGPLPHHADQPPRSSLAQLEAALGDEPVVVVVESAEHLLRPETEQLADLDLDEAFEVLATERHRVKLVLVTTTPPKSPRATWPGAADAVPVKDLPYEYFVEFLASRDDVQPSGLSEQPPALLDRFHRAVQGNPRTAEVAHAILTLDGTADDAGTLIDRISTLPRADVAGHLVETLLKRIGQQRRRVLDALAAFATPVEVEALATVLEEAPRPVVDNALRQLVAWGLVRRRPGQVSLTGSDLERMLGKELDRSRSDLLLRAAEELRERHPAPVHNPGELRTRLAEFTALLRYRHFATAYSVLEPIDRILDGWNCRHLLLSQREEIRDLLEDSHQQMSNENALGDLYAKKGMTAEASEAYGRALKIAQHRDDDASRTRLRANMAAMYMYRNETSLAFGYHDLALREALDGEQPEVVLGALEGLASCLRRWGRYDEAIAHARRALAVYAQTPAREAGHQAATTAFRCTLKLARWHTELGQPDDATGYLDAAKRTAEQRPGLWLTGSYLDAEADFELSRGETGAAARIATEAVDQALKISDPVTLLQARTTLCVASLADNDPKTAAQEITRAHRYRLGGRALIVVALLALTERLRGNTGKAEDHFQRLYEEATERTRRDGTDFTAWDMLGFALCARHPADPDALGRAVTAFRTARSIPTSPAPVLIDRLKLMLTRLDRSSPDPGLLQPAIDACGTGSRHSGTPD